MAGHVIFGQRLLDKQQIERVERLQRRDVLVGK